MSEPSIESMLSVIDLVQRKCEFHTRFICAESQKHPLLDTYETLLWSTCIRQRVSSHWILLYPAHSESTYQLSGPVLEANAILNPIKLNRAVLDPWEGAVDPWLYASEAKST